MGRDVVDHQDLQSSGWGLGDRFQDPALLTPELLTPEVRQATFTEKCNSPHLRVTPPPPRQGKEPGLNGEFLLVGKGMVYMK